MSFLDMRTVVFSNVISSIVCILVILLLWHQSRKRFAGAGRHCDPLVVEGAVEAEFAGIGKELNDNTPSVIYTGEERRGQKER